MSIQSRKGTSHLTPVWPSPAVAGMLITLMTSTLQAQAPISDDQVRGGRIETPAPDHPFNMPGFQQCITDSQRHEMIESLRDFERAVRPLSRSSPQRADDGASVLYPFHPIGAWSYSDMLNVNFVDLDSSAGLLDFNCSSITYNGHNGIDMLIRTHAEQLAGVPVFAALDGVVIEAHDGEPDMNTVCQGQANRVIIDHGNGRRGLYWHLKNGSVAVNVGQLVRSGQQIGLVASSGCSNWPHLHFESWQDGPNIYEPFAGACRPGPSGWVNQEPLLGNLYVLGFAPARTLPWNWPAQPFDPPRDRQVLLSDPVVFFWVQIANLPANSNWQVRFIRPNGTIAFTSQVVSFGNASFFRFSNWYWSYNILNVAQIPGTWRIQVFLNGSLHIDGPVDAVTQIDPRANAAPLPVNVSLEAAGFPAAQGSVSTNDAILCRVSAPLFLDDPDYNLVRYRYVWRVNGFVKRDITIAGRTDALAAGLACSGAHVECQVTPTDGQLEAPLAAAATTLAGPRAPDVNCDGVVNVVDLLAVINGWGPCPAPPANCAADIAPPPNGDGAVNVLDLLMVINNWG